jgi:imidazolonepropionase-like amidohydrolase
VTPSAQPTSPPAAEIVDGRGKFLVPGFWDMHVHLSWTTASALPVLIANGVTGVRDMGGRLDEIDAWRTKIAAGLLSGPRILRVGPILNGQSFNWLQLVPGNADATRGAARVLKFVGVDFIKIHRRLPRESYFALIDEAKRLGLQVVGHIPMTVTPEEASDAGQATFEHTETLFEGTFTAGLQGAALPDAIRRFLSEGAARLFERFVSNRTVVTPTMVAFRTDLENADRAAPTDPLRRYVARSLKEKEAQAAPVSAAELSELTATFAALRATVTQLHRSGVTLMTGSDIAAARVPGFTLHGELALLVDAGLTPMQALQAATATPAAVIGKTDDFGSVSLGRMADLVLLDADPLQDIHNTQRIAAVVFGGKVLRRADLDALLREGERLAQVN